MSDVETLINSSAADQLKREKHIILAKILSLDLGLPFVETFLARWWYEERIWFVVGLIPFIILVIRWCQLDAHELNVNLTRFMRLSIIMFAFIAVPIWLLKTRGYGGLISMLWLFLFVAAMFAVSYVSETIAYDWCWPHWVVP